MALTFAAGLCLGQRQVHAAGVEASLVGNEVVDQIYARPLIGFVTDASYPSACDNDTFWEDIWENDPAVLKEWKQEVELAYYDEGDWTEPVAPPPHHPPPHHPPHHKHPEGEAEEYDYDEGDWTEPVAPPPHHPPPHHPPHHKHPEGEAETGEEYDYDYDYDYDYEYKAKTEASYEAVYDTYDEPACCAEGYGEITRGAVEDLATALGMTTMSPTSSFFDLGSGAGKIPMTMALQGYATTATGVELDVQRHLAAVKLAKEYIDETSLEWAAGNVTDGSAMGQGLRLLTGDMLEADLSEATVLYINQACFPRDVLELVVTKIMAECTKLQAVAAYPPLPALVESGRFVEKKQAGGAKYLELPFSMFDYGTKLTVYKRALATTPGVGQGVQA